MGEAQAPARVPAGAAGSEVSPVGAGPGEAAGVGAVARCPPCLTQPPPALLAGPWLGGSQAVATLSAQLLVL